MKRDIGHLPMQERFQHLLAVISGQRFLRKQGLGNEVPFFICPFKPQETLNPKIWKKVKGEYEMKPDVREG